MSNYFTFFPTIEHDLKDTNQKTELTNILRRFRVRLKTKSIASVYYDYTVQEGDGRHDSRQVLWEFKAQLDSATL